jgi:hypothetical protein
MFVDSILDRIGHWLARYLETETSGYKPFTPSDPETLRNIMRPGDILLVEGNEKVAIAIKYLTQSTWSHAALYVGDALGDKAAKCLEELPCLIEVNVGEGCVAVPLSKYRTYNTRICRPVGLTPADCRKVVRFMVSKLGLKYDMRHIFDLARYLLPTPPVPTRWRRRMIALGSGDPSRAICSSLIAQAYQSVGYPILPRIERLKQVGGRASENAIREILHIRHHSLFAPRDFDLSPFFAVVKPTIESGFDYKAVEWSDAEPGGGGRPLFERYKKEAVTEPSVSAGRAGKTAPGAQKKRRRPG